MKITVCKNYDEVMAKASEIMVNQIKYKPDSVLGLATGSTPIGLYKNLIKEFNNGSISFKDIRTFNLDEYYKIKRTNNQSYFYFMNKNLFSHIDIDLNNVDIPNGEADDYKKECEDYDNKIEAAGGIDIQILGIGVNGHIGFNEPNRELFAGTHLTDLTESTINANARFFESKDDVPTKAITMGIASIMKAKKIILLICGKAKHDIFKKLMKNMITTDVPASLLHAHSDVLVLVDEEAYNG